MGQKKGKKMTTAKRYTKEEKLEIIGMLDSGVSLSEIIRQKGVAKSTIHKWKQELRQGVEWKNLPTAKERALEKEVEYYKKKVAELTRDVDLLKKLQEDISQQRKNSGGPIVTMKNWDPRRGLVK